MPSRKKAAVAKKPSGSYLELYIDEFGRIIFVPLTNKTVQVLNGIKNEGSNFKRQAAVYCG